MQCLFIAFSVFCLYFFVFISMFFGFCLLSFLFCFVCLLRFFLRVRACVCLFVCVVLSNEEFSGLQSVSLIFLNKLKQSKYLSAMCGYGIRAWVWMVRNFKQSRENCWYEKQNAVFLGLKKQHWYQLLCIFNFSSMICRCAFFLTYFRYALWNMGTTGSGFESLFTEVKA